MIKDSLQSGFSAVELLITLFIGFLFIAMGYQLYTVAIQGNTQTRETAQASSIAYEKLRNLEITGAGTSPSCLSPPPTTQNVDNNKAVMTTTITCPSYTNTPTLRLVVVKVIYNITQREVTHAMYVKN
jgi:hypothetical protein